MPTLTIAICTRNRAAALGETLDSIDALAQPADWDVELVVVDNGSTDDTGAVLAEFARRARVPVRLLLETRPGLSVARNCALQATTADVVAFTDDDCFPQADWLQCIAEHYSRQDSEAVLSGRVELYNPADLPVTINTSRKPVTITQPTMNLTSLMGCNMALSRATIERVGTFDEAFGAGGRFVSAEDTDYLYRALAAGFAMRYSPDMVVFHNHGRRAPAEREKLMRGYAIGRGAMYYKFWRLGDRLASRSMYWDLRQSVKTVLRWRTDAESRRLCLRDFVFVLRGFFQAVRSYRA